MTEPHPMVADMQSRFVSHVLGVCGLRHHEALELAATLSREALYTLLNPTEDVVEAGWKAWDPTTPEPIRDSFTAMITKIREG